jgi:TetR/AcrR family transcriptional repressor of nem operon
MSKGSETRQRIVAEAASLFNQHGFEGSSMAELMASTGLEKGGIYRHFSSKEEIAADAFDYAWQAAWNIRMQGLDQVPNSVDRLKQFVANFVERRPPIAGGCPLLNTAIDADDGNPVLRAKARSALQGLRASLAATIKSGIGAREMQSAVEAQKLATLLIATLEGALMISRLEGDRQALLTAQKYLDHYLETEVRWKVNRKKSSSRARHSAK